MKKVLKAFLALSLSSVVLASSMIMAQEEETGVEESLITEEVIQEEPDSAIVQPEATEIPEDLINSINSANEAAESRQINGFLDFLFGDSEFFTSLNQVDYSIAHNANDPISAELSLGVFNPENEPTFNYFAYLHQGYILEAQEDEQWVIDDASSIEPLVVELLLGSNTEGEDLKAKYLNYYESDTGYHLVLKEDIDASELWVDLSAQYNIDAVRDNLITLAQAQSEVAGVEVNQQFIDVINTILSEEKLAEILADNSTFELIYDKETYKLLSSFLTLNINVRDVYEILGTNPDEAPSYMRVVSEMLFTNHGEEIDFSFLDEVLPQ